MYAALRASQLDPPVVGSPLLRRIRATAGAGPVNGTDAWITPGGIRLETTDGPPCDELIDLLGGGPCGLGWQVKSKSCACLVDPERRTGCMVDFLLPDTEQCVYYPNLHGGRALDARYRARAAELNESAFTD